MRGAEVNKKKGFGAIASPKTHSLTLQRDMEVAAGGCKNQVTNLKAENV